MCLIAFSYNSHPDYPLIFISNRDEFYNRRSASAHFWDDEKYLYGGKDLEEGGTWLGITSTGKLAALTNYRDPSHLKNNAPTRGHLVTDFLYGNLTPNDYLDNLIPEADVYNGFNLLIYENQKMYYFSNYEGIIRQLNPGVYALSNALLDTPWPKVEKLKKNFKAMISLPFQSLDFLKLLSDQDEAGDMQLPNTGLTYQQEKTLSSIFIRSTGYGTCCSSIVTVNNHNELIFTEKNYPVGGRNPSTHIQKIDLS